MVPLAGGLSYKQGGSRPGREQEAADKAQLKPQSSCQWWLKKSKTLPVSNKSCPLHLLQEAFPDCVQL